MPYFSLILPIYNVEKYLRRCIDSIAANDFVDYEIILVDDGSTDSCPQLCDDLASADERISVIHKANGGLSSARNAGLELARGEYIFWIDSDDWISNDCLSVLHRNTVESSPDIVKFNYKKNPGFSASASEINPGMYVKDEILQDIIPSALEKTATINFSVWSHIYRRSFIRKNRLTFTSERLIGSEDYLFNLQTYSYAENMLVLSDFLYIYDLRDGSLSRKIKPNLAQQYMCLYENMLSFLVENELLERYKDSIAYSIVNKTFCILMRNECILTPSHSLFKAHKNCRELLKSDLITKAIMDYPFSKCPFKECIIVYMMRYRIIWPLMLLHLKAIYYK